ncbi:MAG: JAB domain-containing protein [Spirochaetia bacterium]|nr:JAB domain-containing protein [Spirochaetia bacterium]
MKLLEGEKDPGRMAEVVSVDGPGLDECVWELVTGRSTQNLPLELREDAALHRTWSRWKKIFDLYQSGEASLPHLLMELQEAGLAPEFRRRFSLFWKASEVWADAKNGELRPGLHSPEKIWEAFPRLRSCEREVMKVIYLDAKNRLLGQVDVAVGSYNTVSASAAEILSPALEFRSRRFVLIHNHPAGEASPSEEDLRFTRRLLKASEVLGIAFTDHLIFGRKKYYSFREAGLL